MNASIYSIIGITVAKHCVIQQIAILVMGVSLKQGQLESCSGQYHRGENPKVLWCQKLLQPMCWSIFADTLLLLPLSSGYWCRTERVLKVPSSMETIVGDIVVRPKLEAINQYNR